MISKATRYIQGIRCFCPLCNKNVTPDAVIINEGEVTTSIEFWCDGKHKYQKIQEFRRVESEGKD